MKKALLLILVIISSGLGYLEWGADQSTFLYQAEYDLLLKLITNPISVLHPFTILPLLGQLLLVAALLFKRLPKALTYAGVVMIGLLFGFILFAGLLTMDLRIMASTVPFILFSVLLIREERRSKG